MTELPVEILRLVLAYLSPCSDEEQASYTSKQTASARGCTQDTPQDDLLACCLVNKNFLAVAQPLLYRSVQVLTQRETIRWLDRNPNRNDLASHVQILRLNCLQAESVMMQLLQACVNLRWLTLEAGSVEKKDCLAECINTSLAKCRRLETISLQSLTSIKTLSIVYNLPYRLRELGISGLYKYQAALWDNPFDWIDTDSVTFTGMKALDNWDMYFLLQLCEIHPAKPPTSLTFRKCQIAFDFLPEQTYLSVKEVILHEAPQLLELDHLDRFEQLEHLSISSSHDFLKLSTPLSRITRLTLPDINATSSKIITRWLQKGLFPSLHTVHIERAENEMPSWLLMLQSACSAARESSITMKA